MGWMNTLLIVVMATSAISVIVLVLLQHGKGADMGAAFGGGSSGTIGGVIRATGDSRTSSSDTAHFQNACRQR